MDEEFSGIIRRGVALVMRTSDHRKTGKFPMNVLYLGRLLVNLRCSVENPEWGLTNNTGKIMFFTVQTGHDDSFFRS